MGEASGSAELDPGVVYTRYGVPIVTEETLGEYLDKGLPPFLYASPGGIFARISGDRLRELRNQRGLSLGTLAGIAGVSRRAIQLYEEGAGAEITIVERMEAFLGEPLVAPITIFEIPRAIPRTPAGRDRRGGDPRAGPLDDRASSFPYRRPVAGRRAR